MSPKSTPRHEYFHGYSDTEQDRLYRQARFFEPAIYRAISWPQGNLRIIEPGCGVGAQSEILLRRFPNLSILGVDMSEKQLGRAEEFLKSYAEQKRISWLKSSADQLNLEDSSFDGAFLCFFLEHVPKPVAVLNELRRVLKTGATIYCTEVLNASFFLHPYAPATLQFWFHFNDHQWNLGGDPFCGAKLGNHLFEAGFQNIQTRVRNHLLDRRTPKLREEYMKEFFEMLKSGAPELLAKKIIDPSLVKEMEKEWRAAEKDPHSVLFYSFVQAKATVL